MSEDSGWTAALVDADIATAGTSDGHQGSKHQADKEGSPSDCKCPVCLVTECIC